MEDPSRKPSEFLSYPKEEDPLAYPYLRIVKVPQVRPSIKVPNPGFQHWQEAVDGALDLIGMNVMAPHGPFDDVWVRPGPAWTGTWLWDNAFHSKIWSLCNLDFARYILDSHMKFQQRSDADDPRTYGHVPHSIEKKPHEWTQPPLLAWAYWELFKKNGDKEMLNHVFSPLFDYHMWLNQNRDLNKDGLYSWMHGNESGLDNAPRYDDVPATECDAIDFSALVSMQLRCLIEMALQLGERGTAEHLMDRKRELDDWINQDLWDETRAFYFDKAFAGDRAGEFVGPKMISGWYPLFAGIVPLDRIGDYLRHLTDPGEFWTPFPVPSVARDEDCFDTEMNMWRGPTWVNTNYMIVRGLKGYGFRALPGELAYLTVKHVFDVYRDTGIFYEYYSSLGDNSNIEHFARKNEHSGPRPYFGGWTCLVLNLLVEEMLGVEAHHGALVLDPSVPRSFVDALGGEQVHGQISGVHGWPEGKIYYEVEFGRGDLVVYRFTLPDSMDVHVLEFYSGETIFFGDWVDQVEVEVKNNKDTIVLVEEPGKRVIIDDFKKEQEQPGEK